MTMAVVLHRADDAPLSTVFFTAAFGKDDPFARHREIAWEGSDSMIAGRTSFIGELEVASYPHIETIIVVEGELTLTVAGATPFVLGPQAGAVIGCGTALRVQAGSRVRFVFCDRRHGSRDPYQIPSGASAYLGDRRRQRATDDAFFQFLSEPEERAGPRREGPRDGRDPPGILRRGDGPSAFSRIAR